MNDLQTTRHWYWQCYRVWVPDPQELSKQIELAFRSELPRAAEETLFSSDGINYNIDFRFDADMGPNRPHQYQVEWPDRHREVCQLTVPDEIVEPERVIRHISFNTLAEMAMVQGKERLTCQEVDQVTLDKATSFQSMLQSLEELAPLSDGWGAWLNDRLYTLEELTAFISR